jgi:hypothetical protein
LALISCMLGYKPMYHDGAYWNVNVTLWRCEFHFWLLLHYTVGTKLIMWLLVVQYQLNLMYAIIMHAWCIIINC